MKRFLIGTVTTLSLLGVVACGSDEPETFVPATFQASDGRCYYIDDEGEVEQLKNDGLCPRTAAPVQAADDSDFMFLYFPFLSSPSYRDHYVPAHKRSSFQGPTREVRGTMMGSASSALIASPLAQRDPSTFTHTALALRYALFFSVTRTTPLPM